MSASRFTQVRRSSVALTSIKNVSRSVPAAPLKSVVVGGTSVIRTFKRMDQLGLDTSHTLWVVSDTAPERMSPEIMQFNWGQMKPNGKWLTVDEIAAENRAIRKFMKEKLPEGRFIEYEHGTWKPNVDEKGNLVFNEKGNVVVEYVDLHTKQKTTLEIPGGVQFYQNIIQPRQHNVEAFRNFNDVEKVLKDWKKDDPRIPIIIYGGGPSAIWIAELCFKNKLPFMFQDPETVEDLKKFQKHPRNKEMVKEILSNRKKYTIPEGSRTHTAAEWLELVPVDPDTYNIQQKQEAIREYMVQTGLSAKEITAIDKGDGSPLILGRGTLCIGFDPLEPPKGVRQLAEPGLRMQREDICPLAISGSYKHAELRNFVIYGKKTLELTNDQLMEGLALDEFFVGKHDRPIMQEYFKKHANIDLPIDDPFFTKVKEEIEKMDHPSTKEEARQMYIDCYESAHPEADPTVKSKFAVALEQAMVTKPATKAALESANTLRAEAVRLHEANQALITSVKTSLGSSLITPLAFSPSYPLIMLGANKALVATKNANKAQEKVDYLQKAQFRDEGPSGLEIREKLLEIKFMDDKPRQMINRAAILLNDKHVSQENMDRALKEVNDALQDCNRALNDSWLPKSKRAHETEIEKITSVKEELEALMPKKAKPRM